MKSELRRMVVGFSSTGWARSIVQVTAIAVALLGPTAVGHAQSEATPTNATPITAMGETGSCCCSSPVDCGNGYCCPSGNTCNPFNPVICCPPNLPIACANTCCPAGGHCSPDGNSCGTSCPAGSPVDCGNGFCCPGATTCNPRNPTICCPFDRPISCSGTCCPAGGHCSPDGNSCGTTCPAGFPVDCGNGLCCPGAHTCNLLNPSNTLCCPPGAPTQCFNGCCAGGNTCNTVNPGLCCLPGLPVACQNTCCPAGYQCTADGSGCISPNPCANPDYPLNCGNGFCCPYGDRCASVLVGDVIYPYCCLDLPEEGCCPSKGDITLAASLGGPKIAPATPRGGSSCRRSTKVRPFEVLQIAAGSAGAPGNFDTANHEYSVAFALAGGKGAQKVVHKVPVIAEDSNDSTLSVMIPPFLLSKKGHGKATVFLVTDGVASETCVSTVRISKLPKSASKVPGLVTHSWLRATQTVSTTARPLLESAAAAPYVDAQILQDVGAVAAFNGTPIQAFDPSFNGGVRRTELATTAKHADGLLTAILQAGQNVGDAGYSGASRAWLQALATARDGSDGALQAAEAAYASTVLGASGPTATSVAKFTVACGAVTTAGVGASAALVRGGAAASTAIDAQAAATAICGASLSATATVCGLTAITAGASAPGTGRSAYGKILLRGSARNATAARTNYGGINLATAKVCGCRQPRVKTLIDSCITIIVTCDRIRHAAPRICLPDVPAIPISHSGPTCGNGFVGPGEDCDTALPNSCGAGRTCDSCRCVGTGDVRVTLAWGSVDDLDLHVTDPFGEEIYYGNKTSDSGGLLDVDSNAACNNPQTQPVENIFWNAGAAPRGTYTVRVDYYRRCSSETEVPFSVHTEVDGIERFFDGVLNTPDSCGACSTCGTCSLITSFTR